MICQDNDAPDAAATERRLKTLTAIRDLQARPPVVSAKSFLNYSHMWRSSTETLLIDSVPHQWQHHSVSKTWTAAKYELQLDPSIKFDRPTLKPRPWLLQVGEMYCTPDIISEEPKPLLKHDEFCPLSPSAVQRFKPVPFSFMAAVYLPSAPLTS